MKRPAPAKRSGLPLLGPDGLVWNDHRAPALTRGKSLTVLVPGEQVFLSVVDLPVSSHRQRLSALPFALEESLAEPIEDVHVALGPKVAPNRYLAAAVRRDLMARWVDDLGKGTHKRARLLPDMLTVPRPANEAAWTVWMRGDRALVRQGDGSGFAVPRAALASAWTAAGRPEIEGYGDTLPVGGPVKGAEPPRQVDPAAMAFDLRQGAFAVGGGQSPAKWLQAAAIMLIAGAAAHGAIAAADVAALRKIADEKKAGLETLLQEVAPGTTNRGDAAAQLMRMLPRGESKTRGDFLPLFALTSTALAPMADGMTIRSLTYGAEDGVLNLNIEADDLAALQRIETALAAAGLSPVAGTATTGQGRAEARMSVRAPAGGV